MNFICGKKGTPLTVGDLTIFMQKVNCALKQNGYPYSEEELNQLASNINSFFGISQDDVISNDYIQLIANIVQVDNFVQIVPVDLIIEKGIFLYRARKLDTRLAASIRGTVSENEFWNAPEKNCSLGRMNKEGESLLYVTGQNACTPLNEINLTDGEESLLIKYEVQKDFTVHTIGFRPNYKELEITNPNTIKGFEMIRIWLKKVFSQEIDENNTWYYEITNHIKEQYFPTTEEHLGWGYSSIKDPDIINLALFPSVRDNILKRVETSIVKKAGNSIEVVQRIK